MAENGSVMEQQTCGKRPKLGFEYLPTYQNLHCVGALQARHSLWDLLATREKNLGRQILCLLFYAHMGGTCTHLTFS